MSTTVEFYQVNFFEKPEPDDQGNTITITDCFKTLLTGNHSFQDSYDRDLYKFKSIDEKYICGVFRKVRTGEPIKVGKACTDGWDVAMDDDEGKFETNHLVYAPDKRIVAYIRNHHGNHYKRLEQCLTKAFGVKVELSPLLTKDALETLLSNKSVTKIQASIPVRHDLVPEYDDNWSNAVMQASRHSGAETVKIETNISLNTKVPGSINSPLKAIRNFLGFGATSAKVQVLDIDGKKDWIDLIEDKIQYVFTDYKYSKETLPDESVYEKIIEAYLDRLDEINEAY
jgi:hypothetical protein